MLLDSLKTLVEAQTKTAVAKGQVEAAAAVQKNYSDLKAAEQPLVDALVHDLQLEGYAINPLSTSELETKQAEAAAAQAASVSAEKNATDEATTSRIPANVT